MSDYQARFGGIGRLYGVAALEKIRTSSVCVVGIGGVGSWAAEALARSGVGKIVLVDLDDVCVSNTNRQLHALNGNVGRQKVDVMAERIRLIHPECEVVALNDFFTEKSADSILSSEFDCVIDAIDELKAKCFLLAECRRRSIPVITVGGAGGRRDPTAITTADLSESGSDGLLRRVRKMLRKKYGFDVEPKTWWGIPCVFSKERSVFPTPEGGICEKPPANAGLRLNCASGFGTATFVTGTFGFAAAALALDVLTRENRHD